MGNYAMMNIPTERRCVVCGKKMVSSIKDLQEHIDCYEKNGICGYVEVPVGTPIHSFLPKEEVNKENTVETYTSAEFGAVRSIIIDGEPYFVGKDVAEILGYSNTRDALAVHVDEEDKVVIQKSEIATLEIPNRGLTVINESGLYSLILSSKLPSAKRFKRWVTSEVLPSLRKNGFYSIANEDDALRHYFDRFTNETKKTIALELSEQNKALRQDLTISKEVNKALSDGILTWANRQTINAIIRKYATLAEIPNGVAWNELYKELLYKFHINVKARGVKPYIQHIKDNEWGCVVKSISALCEDKGFSVDKIVPQTQMSRNELLQLETY